MRTRSQPLLPGFEDWLDERASPNRRRGRSNRAPSVDKIVGKAPVHVRKLFGKLRDELLETEGVTEKVQYDDSTGGFAPAYVYKNRELLRLHLDPVLAATLTLDKGDTQLAAMLASGDLSPELKSQTIKNARRSGRRVYLGFLARNVKEVDDLVQVVKTQVSGSNTMAAAG